MSVIKFAVSGVIFGGRVFSAFKSARSIYRSLRDEQMQTADKVHRVITEALFCLAQSGALYGDLRGWSAQSTVRAELAITVLDLSRRTSAMVSRRKLSSDDLWDVADWLALRTSTVSGAYLTSGFKLSDTGKNLAEQLQMVGACFSLCLNDRPHVSKAYVTISAFFSARLNIPASVPASVNHLPDNLQHPELLLSQQDFNMLRQTQSVRSINEWNRVPDLFERDEELTKYTCPLTRKPIRYICSVGNSSVYYERDAIQAFFQNYPNQIPGGWPQEILCSERQLQPVMPLQQIINERLELLRSGFAELSLPQVSADLADALEKSMRTLIEISKLAESLQMHTDRCDSEISDVLVAAFPKSANALVSVKTKAWKFGGNSKAARVVSINLNKEENQPVSEKKKWQVAKALLSNGLAAGGSDAALKEMVDNKQSITIAISLDREVIAVK